MRTFLVALVLASAGLLAVDLEPAAAPRLDRTIVARAAPAAKATVEVAFVRKGRLVRVERVVPEGVAPEVHALRELMQGPTHAERGNGIRSAIRPGARLRSVRADDRVWLASFSRSFFGPATEQTAKTRLAQVAATLARIGKQEYAAIAAEGRLVTSLRLGVRPGAWRPEPGEQGYLFDVRGVQLRLFQLGFLERSAVTGTLDDATSQALLAFQGWEDLARTETVTGETQVELLRAFRPVPSTHRAGRRIEIHRDRGVLLMLEGNDLIRAVHTSTGGVTPAGEFRVYRKERLSWSVPFKVWMPYAAYFVGGIAMHEYSYVPSYPASHGCVRLPAGEAERVYRFVDVGTPVLVI